MEIDKIGIIVDGPSEVNSLEKLFIKVFYKIPALRQGPGNGDNYTEELFAKRVIPTIIALLKKDVYTVILTPDIEKRVKKGKTTIENFAKDIKMCIIDEIVKRGIYNEDYLHDVIFVCPSNIMFENWIVSDVEGIKKSKLIKEECIQDFYDGQNGASLLNDMMISKYKKTRDAHNLFKYVDKNVGINNSPSFKQFMDVLDFLLAK